MSPILIIKSENFHIYIRKLKGTAFLFATEFLSSLKILYNFSSENCMIFYLKNNLQGIEISLVFHPLIQFDAVSYNVKLMSERLLAEKTRFESFQF